MTIGSFAEGRELTLGFKRPQTISLKAGDLIGIDTDSIGPEGYACDISRTFYVGANKASDKQRDTYKIARDFIDQTAELFHPGTSFEQILSKMPKIPERFTQQRYPIFAHGLGMDDEPPFYPFADQSTSAKTNQGIEVGMVICIESYLGEVGESFGVKIEDQYEITETGPVLMVDYPHDDAFGNTSSSSLFKPVANNDLSERLSS